MPAGNGHDGINEQRSVVDFIFIDKLDIFRLVEFVIIDVILHNIIFNIVIFDIFNIEFKLFGRSR